MRQGPWKVGELARRTGLTVRTLHHYDEIGLLSPSYHTEAGHRLYGDRDVVRLQQIKSLRQLGFSLEQIRDFLRSPDGSPLRVVQLHLEQLREQCRLQQELLGRLEGLARLLQSAEDVSTEDFLKTIEVMTRMEKYYTPEMLEELAERRKAFGEEKIREVEAEWPQLIAKARAEMEKGTDPAAPEMQALARRWRELVDMFTGGNPAIEKALRTMYQNEPTVAMQNNLDPKLFEYVGKAIAAAESSS